MAIDEKPFWELRSVSEREPYSCTWLYDGKLGGKRAKVSKSRFDRAVEILRAESRYLDTDSSLGGRVIDPLYDYERWTSEDKEITLRRLLEKPTHSAAAPWRTSSGQLPPAILKASSFEIEWLKEISSRLGLPYRLD